VNDAISAARDVFTPEVTKVIFSNPSTSPALYSLLFALSAPAQNELFRLGIDLLAVSAVRCLPPKLRDDLQLEESYWGARFELAILAATCRESIPTIFDPLRRLVRVRTPDLLLGLEQPTFAELKAVNPSEVWRQREQTYLTILLGGGNPEGMVHLANVDIAFTDEYKRLDATPEGRSRLAREANDLGRSIAAAARVVSSNSAVVNGLVHLTIAKDGVPEVREPLIPDYEGEAARVVSENVLNASEQLPLQHPGIVIIETARSWAPVPELMRQTRAWFEDPVGREYQHVAGVFYTYYPWWTKCPCVALTPVWRPTAPPWLVRSRRLRHLANGLRWADVCAWDWRRKHAR